ncbi:MAG: hypothetical protein Q7R56_02940 [Nanoarchaeota archaeon]|nr:hypothetical protein [Nanoarchaeota archaeon]
MKVLPFLLISILLLTACGTKTQNSLTGSTVAPGIQEVSNEKLASTDCRVAIQALQEELNNLEQEKNQAATELGKAIREAKTTKDQQRLQELNKKIDDLSQRVKEIRKGLIPTIQQSIALKQKNCP